MRSFTWILAAFPVFLLVNGRLFDYFRLAGSKAENNV